MESLFGNLRKNLRKASEKRGQGKAEKKQGGVGGGRPEKKQGGVGGGRPERMREGWVGDDVIKKK